MMIINSMVDNQTYLELDSFCFFLPIMKIIQPPARKATHRIAISSFMIYQL